ncbi:MULTISPECIES: DUF4124 domain-containing protein [unclassified Lysobacter]|uniref:DUF4124 domain-containing protein n=1 Tax=unclassified Lysobacter TaxID=2635362 RepID=UPI001C22E5E9|nr:DUF4124 domain-containing protein [Lysobacter sp. MMG2]MBU8975620.1 DUF4124 domain-containing protein [Lysobacter sp. MMG2]
MSKTFRLLPGLVAGLSLLLATPAFAAKVYQWKDEKGVTHYSDAPPPGQDIKGRNLATKDGTAPAAQPAAKPVAANANCTNARSNLSVLQGGGQVGIDEDKDGKPDRSLNDSERANRTALAEAQIKTYCESTAVSSGS